MNKMKKLVVMLLSIVCVCAFAATSAFAADYSNAKSQIKAYLASYGVDAGSAVDALTDSQIDNIKAQQGSLEALVASTAAEVKANPGNAQAIVDSAAASVSIPDVVISSPTVTVSGDKVTASATVTVNGASVPAAASVATAVADDHGDIGEAIKNGTWGKDDSKTAAAAAANTLTASGASVIKATGDSSAAVVIAAVLAVAAVLGMAVRKNTQMNVA